MLTPRAMTLGALVAALTACGPSAECNPDTTQCTNLAEGKRCTTETMCAKGLVCFPQSPNGALGECRKACSVNVSCNTGFNCFEAGGSIGGGCVPEPGPDEPWTLIVQNLSVPATKPGGGTWDGSSGDVPDPFVCFGNLAGSTLCTSEQHGYAGSWKTSPFTTSVATNALLQASITVFDSDAIFDFSGCEGSCSALAGWAKDTVYGKAFDLRPLWTKQVQTWELTESNGFRLELQLKPTP